VEDTSFKLWYTCLTTTKNEVGIVIDKNLNNGVVDIKRQGGMIILVKLLIGDLILNVISAYVPQIGRALRGSSGKSQTSLLVVCPSPKRCL
jgi:hypothetical protein